MFKKGELKNGDIVWVQFSPSIGHEFQDKRPAMIVQSNRQLAKTNLVTVMPIISNIANKMTDDIIIGPDGVNNLKYNSVIKVSNIISCDYRRIFGKIGVVDENITGKVKAYLKLHFEI